MTDEKAFNRVNDGYLLGTLQAFGFGPQFVSFLQVLYASAECLVRLNWTLTEPVSFGRGVRQGRLTGLVLREPELRLVLSAYTDDLLLVVQDPGDLARVEACQAIYLAASSAQANWIKSSGLAVGDWRQTLQRLLYSAGSSTWSILAHAFLRCFQGLRYDRQLFYLCPRGFPRDLSGLPVFYQDLLRTWKLFSSTRSVVATMGADLLAEPLLHNPQLRVQAAESCSVRQ
ncbi:unnamed protein product, partial [Caretta caretta]